MNPPNDFTGLPGAELVDQGLRDLEAGVLSECALLVIVAGPRLRSCGIEVKRPDGLASQPVEHTLYELIETRLGVDAHSYYNSLLRGMASFAHALERERSQALP